jgi:hypothetical protein
MAIPSNLTLQHAKIDANISMMRDPLNSEHESFMRDDASFEKLKERSARIGEMLRGYVQDEQRILLGQATRVLGDSLEEVCEIHEQNAELLEQFDRFNQALNDIDVSVDGQCLIEVRARFAELCACFERQSDAERNFYSLYSTILFPAGAATD